MVGLEHFEDLRLRLVAYEAQQELGQTKMKSEVKEQVSEVTDGLQELYNTASAAVGAVAARRRAASVTIAQRPPRPGAARRRRRRARHLDPRLHVGERRAG